MRRRALVVEDEPISRYVLINQLKHFKIDSYEAETVLSALGVLNDQIVDVVFLDLLLPNQGGLLFLKVRNEIKHFKTIPVIVISAKADLPTIGEAIREGATSYLIKPFQNNLLIEALRECGFEIEHESGEKPTHIK